MLYLCSLYEDESQRSGRTPEEAGQTLARYLAFTEAAREAGIFVAGEGLQPTSTATTVRVRDGERLIVDGPFAETKEQLGGYYLIECADLDAAIAIAADVPGAVKGSIEIRPIRSLS